MPQEPDELELNKLKQRLDAIEGLLWPDGDPPSGPTIFAHITKRLDDIDKRLDELSHLTQAMVTKEEFDKFRIIVGRRLPLEGGQSGLIGTPGY